MSEQRNLFGILDDISANQAEILTSVTGVKTQVSESDQKIAELEKAIQELKRQQISKQTVTVNKPVQPQQSQKDILYAFLKKAKKSWRWFGNRSEFSKSKNLAIFSTFLMFIFGIASTVLTAISCKGYSYISIFENIWLICGLFFLTYGLKSQYIYEVNALASNSPLSYERDEVGMLFSDKEKIIFRVFRWLAGIAAVANIIFMWTRKSDLTVFATIMEVLFVASIIFAFFMNLNHFSQYCIAWVEGNNLTTNEKVVLVRMPGDKGLMTEEEFRKKMPIFC